VIPSASHPDQSEKPKTTIEKATADGERKKSFTVFLG